MKISTEILEIADIFRAKVVDLAYNSLTIGIVGDPGKIIAIQKLLNNQTFEVVDCTNWKIAIERDLGINTQISKIA